MKSFCTSLSKYIRRPSCAVQIGSVNIGADNPIAVQSMANCSTMDTLACVEQIGAVASVGCRIMRLTAPSMREAENLGEISQAAREHHLGNVALVADIHYTPNVAMAAAEYVDKVRINPGNYSNENGEFAALLTRCAERGVALRIGVNHGSLAGHIVEQFGDTPRGMVASAMEFLEQCRDAGFGNVVVSMKSSNVRVMVHAYRLLSAQMMECGMNYPLHLGVTEAGDGDDARIKSAVGIGALLNDGLGDTIRVSLTEPPQNEVPVAKALADYFVGRETEPETQLTNPELYSPYEYKRRTTTPVGRLGANNVPLLKSELTEHEQQAVAVGEIVVLESEGNSSATQWRAETLNMSARGDMRPVILHKIYNESLLCVLQLKAAVDFGMLFLDGLADGIWIENADNCITRGQMDELSLSILQASRTRISKTEYIACPGCGRTLYDLQSTLAAIRSRTNHLVGLKIGVMGCIVNGPGEMADADYGYVGEGAGRVTLYKGRTVVRRSVAQSEAIDALVELIKQGGDWKE